MKKYNRNGDVVVVFTFDALIEYGKNTGANMVNGMPWSFGYNGVAVSHENDTCYILTDGDGVGFMFYNDEVVAFIDGYFFFKCKESLFNEFSKQPEWEEIV